MKTIKLTRGQFALVDDEDHESLSRHRWCAQRAIHSWYAIRGVWVYGKVKTIRMHRVLIGCKEHVDHIDGDGLNNQRSNLRVATRSQNAMNCRKRNMASSAFKGVSRCPRAVIRPWLARVTAGYRTEFIGSFELETDAACAYDAAAKLEHGEFARLNLWRGVL